MDCSYRASPGGLSPPHGPVPARVLVLRREPPSLALQRCAIGWNVTAMQGHSEIVSQGWTIGWNVHHHRIAKDGVWGLLEIQVPGHCRLPGELVRRSNVPERNIIHRGQRGPRSAT